MAKQKIGKPKKQVAALPVIRAPDGDLQVLVMTSRETKRFVVPKGWPMKGREDHEAAEIEAREEAGLLGRARRKPIGSYLAWKRTQASMQLIKVKVFLFEVSGQLTIWKEKGQRNVAWMKIQDAALLVDEPGLAAVLLDLPHRLPKDWRSATPYKPLLDSAR